MEGSEADVAADEDSDIAPEPAPESSYGETALKISQLKAQIHHLESRLNSSSESSSDEEQDVRSGWLSAKAENLAAEVARLHTEAADAQEKHSAAMQASDSTGLKSDRSVVDVHKISCHKLAEILCPRFTGNHPNLAHNTVVYPSTQCGHLNVMGFVCCKASIGPVPDSICCQVCRNFSVSVLVPGALKHAHIQSV